MGLSHCTRALANSSNAWQERPGPAPSTLAASELARLSATRNSTSAIIQPCHDAFIWCGLTSPQWAAYAARHGYDHLVLRERLVFSHEWSIYTRREPRWDKVDLAAALFTLDYAWVLFTDGDSRPLRPETSIAAFVADSGVPEACVFVSQDSGHFGTARPMVAHRSRTGAAASPYGVNSGVLLLRRCSTTDSLLASMLAHSRQPVWNHCWPYEQGPLNLWLAPRLGQPTTVSVTRWGEDMVGCVERRSVASARGVPSAWRDHASLQLHAETAPWILHQVGGCRVGSTGQVNTPSEAEFMRHVLGAD